MTYQSQVALFVHIVWATWDRLPLLNGELERDVYRALGAECVALGAEPIAIGGTEDHVHMLIRLPATIALAELMRRAKGASAHFVTHRLAPGQMFKWQGGYGAFSVSPRHIRPVADYIARQRDHHAADSIHADWEPPTERLRSQSAEADFGAAGPQPRLQSTAPRLPSS